jgi:hypothetical protein
MNHLERLGGAIRSPARLPLRHGSYVNAHVHMMNPAGGPAAQVNCKLEDNFILVFLNPHLQHRNLN